MTSLREVTAPYRPDPAVPPGGRALHRIAGLRVLVVGLRDIRNPRAGGPETFMHETARRWVTAGASVTLLAARAAGRPAREVIDGVVVRRAGGARTVALHSALRLLRRAGDVDVVVVCRGGRPSFTPMFSGHRTPVLQVVHHSFDACCDRPGTRVPAAVAALARSIEGRAARRAYAAHRSVAVSASMRREVRRELGLLGVVDVIPDGVPAAGEPAATAPAVRATAPTIVITGRLHPHRRIDLLLQAVAVVRAEMPRIRLEIVGDGPELGALRRRTHELGLDTHVTFHGHRSDDHRDALLSSAWLTTCTAVGDRGFSAVVAAAAGVPCLALRAPGVGDTVIDGHTGWLVDGPDSFGDALASALAEVAVPARAAAFRDECRQWAACFTWDRIADLLAASVVSEVQRRRMPPPTPWGNRPPARRYAGTDPTTLAWFTHPDPAVVLNRLRLTDEVAVHGTTVTAILRGYDTLDARLMLENLGAVDVRARRAGRHEIIGGPSAIGGPATRSRLPIQKRSAQTRSNQKRSDRTGKPASGDLS